MTVVQLMVFVCARVPLLIDNAARCQLACLIASSKIWLFAGKQETNKAFVGSSLWLQYTIKGRG